MIARLFLCTAALAGLPLLTSAATSTAWEVSGFNDFLKGHLAGLALDANGRLSPGPKVNWTTPLDQPALWNLAAAPDGSVYAATGHSGKVLKITPDGKVTLVWSAPQSEVFAICLDARGGLFAATSPGGGLYRIADGKAQEVWHSPAKYIWSLQPAPNGVIYVGTGEGGRIFRYDGNGKTDLYYETGQGNVTALAMGPSGHLLAGSDPNGLLYDVSGPGRATVLYDSTLPEIHSIAVDEEGTVYAAALGGAVASRMAPGQTPAPPSPAGPVTAITPTVITVTAAKTSGTPAAADDQAAKPADQTRSGVASAAAAASNTATGVTEVSGVEKSAIYRIRRNGAIETMRSSKEENVYSILLDGKALLFSTDDHGRLYRLADGRTSLLAELGSGEATCLIKNLGNVYAALSNSARVVSLNLEGRATGRYESQVHDASSVARWGHLQWHGTGSGVVFRTRTGYSARPDSTWSPWSGPIGSAADSLIKSPSARYIQFQAEWGAVSDAQISTVDLPYLSQNSAPTVRSIAVTSVAGTNAAKTGAGTPPATAAYSITVTDTGEAPAASAASSSSQTVSRLQTTQTQISWQADDPDSDKLVYSIYFRAEDENEWQMIRNRMFENTLLLDPDVFADGRYFFRVAASDAPANAPDYARQSELISNPVLIDNTPPAVTIVHQGRADTTADIEIEAHDKSSPLRLCEYSLDAGTWQPIEAIDGITDSPDERFRVHLDKLRPGEHLVVFRAYDTAGNAGLSKVVLR